MLVDEPQSSGALLPQEADPCWICWICSQPQKANQEESLDLSCTQLPSFAGTTRAQPALLARSDRKWLSECPLHPLQGHRGADGAKGDLGAKGVKVPSAQACGGSPPDAPSGVVQMCCFPAAGQLGGCGWPRTQGHLVVRTRRPGQLEVCLMLLLLHPSLLHLSWLFETLLAHGWCPPGVLLEGGQGVFTKSGWAED